MDTFGNALLGLLFLLLSIAGTFLMYKLWGYPFDHEKLKSSAPPRLMLLHHIIGYLYGAIYVYLMFQMVPRLWSYEVEFPARTVAHLMLGMTIGVTLLVKVAIVRFFKHLESTLVPFLGTALLICTFLLIGLSVPFAMKEFYLHATTVGGTPFSEQNMERVKMLLPKAGFPAEADLSQLVTETGLKQGRDVLLKKCVQCHDLRTVLVKPRTPENWVQTVDRMAERSVLDPISESEQWHAAAYLIAISPELQRSFKQKRDQEMAAARTVATVKTASMAMPLATPPRSAMNLEAAKQTFEETCSQCHGLKNVEKSPPATPEEVTELIERMVENGLDAPQQDLVMIQFYLTETYTKSH